MLLYLNNDYCWQDEPRCLHLASAKRRFFENHRLASTRPLAWKWVVSLSGFFRIYSLKNLRSSRTKCEFFFLLVSRAGETPIFPQSQK